MAKNTDVQYIIEKSMDRQKLTTAQIIKLLNVPRNSLDVYNIMGAANLITRHMAGNEGIIAAQIGLNVEPCSKNCEFCSFAAKHNLVENGYKLSEEQVSKKTKDFVEAGANYVSLMATADYPFEQFIKISEAAKKHIPAGMMLSANIGDFSREEARQLKQVGYGRVYHVLRLGEGKFTEIDPDDRIRTIEEAASENLEIAFCIEPVGIEHTSEEIAEKIELSLRFKPTTAAVMRRVPIKHSLFENSIKLTEARMAHIMAVLRLAYAYTDTKTFYIHEPSLPGLMAGANMICAETAANPRELVETGESIRGYTVDKCRDMLFEAGYTQRKESNFPGSWFNER